MSKDLQNYGDYSMLDLFRMEMENQKTELNRGLLELENNPEADVLESLMRAVHSIKGAAQLVDVRAIVRIAHALEESLLEIQRGKVALSREVIDKLLFAVDVMVNVTHYSDEEIMDWGQKREKIVLDIETSLHDIVDGKADNFFTVENEIDQKVLADVESEKTYQKNEASHEEIIRVDALKLSKVLSLAADSLVETRRFENVKNSLFNYKKKQNRLLLQLERFNRLLEDQYVPDTIKEELHSIIKNGLGLQQYLSQRMADLDSLGGRVSAAANTLHNEILSVRMRPFAVVVQALPRMVRDISRRLDKKVKLRMTGLATLADREVLKRIDTTIVHLIQNAIDHGIEFTAKRKTRKKPEFGTIVLQVSQTAGMLFIVVEDDGRGIDIARLRMQLVEKDIVDEFAVAKLKDEEVLDFMFMPGFSTRKTVSEISGRGVGLDVVKDAISFLGGIVKVTTVLGKGTQFRLLLPLTVSVVRVLLFVIKEESYAFPLTDINYVTRVSRSEIKSDENGSYIIREQRLVTLISGAQMLGYANGEGNCQLDIELVSFGAGDCEVAMVVDSLEGEAELSIQSVEQYVNRASHVSSAAIKEDGGLSLVLDVEGVAQRIRELRRSVGLWSIKCVYKAPPKKNALLVIGVDELSKGKEKLMQQTDHNVFVAKSMGDAWRKVLEYDFDIIVMEYISHSKNIIRLIGRIRNELLLRDVPIFLIGEEKYFDDFDNLSTLLPLHFFTEKQFTSELLVSSYP